MRTFYCKWPPERQAEAAAYDAEAVLQAQQDSGDPSAGWMAPREDQNGNWTVAYYGPPGSIDGINDLVETPVLLALRQDAVIVETPEWPVVPGED